jgi:hypothetical protein
MWDLWWRKWHWDRFFSEYFGFSCKFHSTGAPLKLESRKLIIFLIGLHNKPQGCGASVSSIKRDQRTKYPFNAKVIKCTHFANIPLITGAYNTTSQVFPLPPICQFVYSLHMNALLDAKTYCRVTIIPPGMSVGLLCKIPLHANISVRESHQVPSTESLHILN